MNTKHNLILIKGEVKTSEIMSCEYNNKTQKWDVTFNNGKTYSYANENVEKLTEPESLNPNMRKNWTACIQKTVMISMNLSNMFRQMAKHK